MGSPGGKSGAGVFQRIINLLPPHQVYVEPFLGGGAIMRLKRPAALNVGLDLDARAITRATLELARPPGGANFGMGELVKMLAPGTRSHTVYGRQLPAPGGGSIDVLEDSGSVGPIVKCADSRRRDPLAGSGDVRSPSYVLGVADGLAFLRSFKFRGDEVVYCDPPYMMDTRPSGKRLYRFEMGDGQHAELMRLVRRLPCFVLVSGYFTPFYAGWLKNWNLERFTAMTRGGGAAECLWFNFRRPVALHQYDYLGAGFRERERIKRKKDRWVAKLRAMPDLERQALLAAIADSGGFGEAPALLGGALEQDGGSPDHSSLGCCRVSPAGLYRQA